MIGRGGVGVCECFMLHSICPAAAHVVAPPDDFEVVLEEDQAGTGASGRCASASSMSSSENSGSSSSPDR
jgi:hypothetical protein